MADRPVPIRFAVEGAVGIVTLDRQEALNALSLDMVEAFGSRLATWRTDPAVAAVLVRAVPGRAFCAGGDVRRVNEISRADGVAAALPFFFHEYRMNWRIKHLGKPYIALLDGVTMGGGVGISVHGTHRVTSENSLFAMPETGIGFFPDVGGTWFLPRCPGATGMYLALTGARLGAADCHAAGIATHHVPSARHGEFVERLAAVPAEAFPGVVDEVLDGAAEDPPAESEIATRRPLIDGCFGAGSLPDILEALAHEPTGWGSRILAEMRAKSPFATAVVHEQMRRGAALDFTGAMRLEYRMVRRFLESGEFYEGVRALLIDKDKQPRWRHRDLAAVPADAVDAVFAPLAGGDLPLDWNDRDA